MATDVVFGAFVPQGWKMELSGIDGAEAKWAKAVEVAQLAEGLGYDSVWLYDHVHNVPRPAHEAVFECWTTIAAISQVTHRVRLGDRKSTRLNSSHPSISYAVFCLKKKKKMTKDSVD